MNQRFKAILLFLLDPRSIILAFALFNFILIWKKAWDLAHSGIACVVCPWYHPWSWFNEPSLLLAAALFLRLNKTKFSMVAVIFSGYLVGYFVHILLRIDDVVAALRADWRIIRMDYPYIFGSWVSQYLFAFIILCCSIFFSTRGVILRRKALHRTADNNALQLTAR
jgi:hypothetical protein